jgi:nucleotide-binding universal stress UspA family protein
MREIVIGADSSDAAAEATRRAGRLAKETGATLTVVHVHYLPSLATPQVIGLEDLQARWKEADRLVPERTADVLDPLGVPWRFEVRTGEPAAELEALAAERRADMIVVGNRGHGLAHRLLLGSVSNRLVHHADQPVLLVRKASGLLRRGHLQLVRRR